MKMIGKMVLGVIALLISILSAIANVLDTSRNTIMIALRLLQKAVKAGGGFLFVAMLVSFIVTPMELTEKLLNIAGAALVVFLAYKIFAFAYDWITIVFDTLLGLFAFDQITLLLTKALQKVIWTYINILGDDEPTHIDRILLFGGPFVLHKINSALRRCGGILHVLLPSAAGMIGAVMSYRWLYQHGASDFELADHAAAWFLIIFIALLAAYFSYCLSEAVKEVLTFALALDDLYCAYAEFFWHSSNDTSGTSYTKEEYGHSNTGTKNQSQENRTGQNSEEADNPYYIILVTAKDGEELKKLYRTLSKELHPDVCKNLTIKESTRRQALLNSAYADLKNRFY